MDESQVLSKRGKNYMNHPMSLAYYIRYVKDWYAFFDMPFKVSSLETYVNNYFMMREKKSDRWKLADDIKSTRRKLKGLRNGN